MIRCNSDHFGLSTRFKIFLDLHLPWRDIPVNAADRMIFAVRGSDDPIPKISILTEGIFMRRNLLLSTPGILRMSAYANTLTRMLPELYAALDVVSRELVGFIPSVNRNTGVERAALGQEVVWPIAPPMTTFNVTPAMQVPEPTDRGVENNSMKITKSKGVDFGWTGEEQLGLSHGPGALTIQGGWFAQALRTLTNEIEADLALEAAINGSRAWGTAGTTPFAPGASENFGDSAQLRKILDDNGAPIAERSLIIDTAAGANVRTHKNFTRANESGDMMSLRDGQLFDLHGFATKESAQVVSFVKGTAAGATTNTAGYAIGARTITLAAAGTGTIKKGDIVTFAGDANKYIAAADVAAVSGGVLTIVSPGLRQAIPAAATNITLAANAVHNAGFNRDALALAARPPALPNGTDAAVDNYMLTDPRSGLAFEVRLYEGYRKIRAEVALAWGVKAIKPEHIAILLG